MAVELSRRWDSIKRAFVYSSEDEKGGSQPRLYGPFPIDASDIPNEGDSVVIFTPGEPGAPAVGDHVLAYDPDPAGTEFDARLTIGQAAAPGDIAFGVDCWGRLVIAVGPGVGGWCGSAENAVSINRFIGGNTIAVESIILTADPVYAVAEGNLTQGLTDLWVVAATPA